MPVNVRGLFGTREGKRVGFEDGISHETTAVFAPVQFQDDFLGADIVIPAGGSDESGCKWCKKIVSANATLAGLANAAGGVIFCALAANDEKEDATLYTDDQLTFPLNTAAVSGAVGMGLVFEARCKLAVLPTTAAAVDARVFIGLAGAWADDAISATRMGFRAYGTGGGLIYCETDDATTDSGFITSGVTLDNATWAVFRIDASNPANILFYINGNRVAAGTTFTMVGAPTASVVLQPMLGVYKTNKAGLATLHVDYVRIWNNRA